ncbi:MAG: HAD family hydrolase [Clostridia bacterium]|nr:HAD family hydrolase [Clostridia bacterium]
MKYDSIGFDLDGTLWSSIPAVTQAWDIIASEYGVYKPNEEQMAGVMGLNEIQLMTKLYPDMPQDDKLVFFGKASKKCNELLAEHGGVLFDGMAETIEKLSKDFKLYIVSNCQPGYIETFLGYHKLEKYFCDFQWSGRECVPKSENIKSVINRNGFKNSIYVGDTQGDADAAYGAGVPFVFAEFGFGNVKKYDYSIEKFSDILKIVY